MAVKNKFEKVAEEIIYCLDNNKIKYVEAVGVLETIKLRLIKEISKTK